MSCLDLFRTCNYNGGALSIQRSVRLSDKRSPQGLYQQVTMVLSARTGFFLLHRGAGTGEAEDTGENTGPVTRQSRSVDKNASFPALPLPTPAPGSANSPTRTLSLPPTRMPKPPRPSLWARESRKVPQVISSFSINTLSNSRSYWEERSKYFHMLSYASNCAVPQRKSPGGVNPGSGWNLTFSLHFSLMLREDAFHIHSLNRPTF